MTVVADLLVITDGRQDLIDQTIASAEENLRGATWNRWIYDDSGDPANRAWLVDRFPDFRVFWHPAGRQGFGGAIRYAWEWLRAHGSGTYIFHLEDDFTFRRPVPVDVMAKVLDRNPKLAQLALRRQPWNDEERDAGGIVEAHPQDFGERTEWIDFAAVDWLAHRRFFTTNPCLYRFDLIVAHEWPEGEHSEGRFGISLLGAGMIFGYFGKRSSGEWVEHHGHVRVGTGY